MANIPSEQDMIQPKTRGGYKEIAFPNALASKVFSLGPPALAPLPQKGKRHMGQGSRASRVANGRNYSKAKDNLGKDKEAGPTQRRM